MLPDGTPCFAAGGAYYALNGKPMFEEGVVCRYAGMYGYCSMKNTNTGESFTIGENGDIVDTDRYRIDERYLAFIEDNDLVTVYSGDEGRYETLISISTGEVLFEGRFGENLSWLVVGGEKASLIQLKENDIY